MGNNKGAALLTTMLLGILALAVIGALMTFILYGKKTSVVEVRYTSALESAKGAADYIMKGLIDNNINCKTATSSVSCPCSELLSNLQCPSGGGTANKIDLGSYSTIGSYNITAEILSKVDTGTTSVYAIRVISQKPSSPEKAEIEFVLRVEY